MTENQYLIFGIDPGLHTGIAFYNLADSKFITLATLKIHNALEIVERYIPLLSRVIVEDARKWNMFGKDPKRAAMMAQGTGSAKRDAKIWEDYLKDRQLCYMMKRPTKKMTKMNKLEFELKTGYIGRTSQHSRDAACLILHYLSTKEGKKHVSDYNRLVSDKEVV